MSYVSSVSSDVMAYQPVTTSGAVNFTGLGNGTDFNEIIDAQIEAESFQKEKYEAELAETEACTKLLDELNSSMKELDKKLEELNSTGELLAMEVNTSSDDVTCKVTGAVQESSHHVEVDQLAQNDVWVNESITYAAPTDVITGVDSTFAFECDGEEVVIDVPANTTAEGLVKLINNDPVARDLVEADLLFDGDEYYFRMTGKQTGADHAITYTDSGDLAGYSSSDFSNTRVAQNSKCKIDGFPAGADEWLERDSNTVEDVIAGLELTLTDTTDAGGMNITVTCDEEVTKENINTFMEELNAIIYDIQVLSGRIVTYVEDEETGEQMEAYTIDSYGFDMMYNELKSLISLSVEGFDRDQDTYNALSQIGLYTDADESSETFGQLLLDEELLDEALEEDPYAVAALLGSENKGVSDTNGVQVLSTIEGITQPGEYSFEYEVVGGVITSATINGEPAIINGNKVTGAAETDSAGIALEVSDLSEGSHNADLRVQLGAVSQIQNAIAGWTNSEDGTIPMIMETYESNATKLENDIYYQEKRLNQLEQDLNRKYAALDAQLAYYTNLQSSLTAMIAS